MKDPLQQYAQNPAALHKIPLFNPRFRKVYGFFSFAWTATDEKRSAPPAVPAGLN